MGGIAFVVGALVAQFVPLLDVIGYEYATWMAIMLAVIGPGRVIRRYGDTPAHPWRTALRASADLLALVGVGTAISLANAVRVRSCEPGVGLLFVAVLTVGAIAPVVATSLVAARAVRGRWRYVLAWGVVFVSVASGAWYLATQPSIVAYDTFVGYFAGSIYDESLVGFGTHVLFRAWTTGASLVALALLAMSVRATLRDATIVALLTPALIGVWMARGDLGLERDRDWVIDALGGHVATEHFDIYYDARSYNAERLRLLAADHEARYAELAAFWGFEPGYRLRSFVYGSSEQRGDYMGGRRTLVAKIWLGEMHITWRGPGHELLGHEMAHLFLREHGSGPLRLSSAWGVVPIMALVEGAATAPAWGADDMSYHAWSAAMYRLGFGEDITELLGPAGFWGRYSRRAYTLTGSFARWLIDTRGPAAFLAAYPRGDFEGAYGEPLPDLVAQWRAFLDELPLDESLLPLAEFRYDRPSLFGRLCARSIATRFEEGAGFVRARREDDAARCFGSILADDPDNVTYRLRIARQWASMGAEDRAREQADWVVGAEGAGLAARRDASELLADLLWNDGAREDALSRYRELLDGAVVDSDRRRLQAKIQAIEGASTRPLTEQAVRRYLAARPATPGDDAAATLSAAAFGEDSALAGYLVAIRFAHTSSPLVERVWDALDVTELTDEQQRNALRARALHLWVIDEFEASCALWSELGERAAPSTEDETTAQMWLGRCARGSRAVLDVARAPVE